MKMQFENFHEAAEFLWDLLDDIDTAGDIAKNDDKLYRAIVEGIHRKRALVAESKDGYTLEWKVGHD
jgi:hypothetical protein